MDDIIGMSRDHKGESHDQMVASSTTVMNSWIELIESVLKIFRTQLGFKPRTFFLIASQTLLPLSYWVSGGRGVQE